MRVADLSCGGGVFLIAALERMRAYCHAQDPEGVAATGGDLELRQALAGRALGVDIDPRAAEVCRLALALWIGGPGSPELARRAIRVADALEADLPGELSAVVGNPPWGQKGFALGKDRRARLRRRFRTADGALDPFKLFIERTHELLAEGGRWGLVVPDILLLKSYESTRRLILEGTQLDRFVILGRAFAGVNLDAVVVVGARSLRPDGRARVAICEELDGGVIRHQRQEVFSELPASKFNLYLDDQSLALYRRLRAFPRLGERFEIHEGVHSGNVRAKLFSSSRPPGPCAPLILGRDELQPFRLRWAGRFIDLDPDLVDKSQGEYANLGRPHWHLSPKLVVRRTGDRVIAARDMAGHYVSNNLIVL